MNKKEMIEYIEKYIIKDGKLNIAVLRWNKADVLFEDLIRETSVNADNIKELLYLFYYNKEKVYCECGKPTTFLGFSKGYSNYCSNKCAQSSKEIINKKKLTSLQKYGTENPNSLNEIKDKTKQTNLKKYGIDSHNKVEEIKEKKRNIFQEKYGFDNPMQSKTIKSKAEQTNLIKYGAKNPFAFGSEKYNELLKNKYGVENISQFNFVKNQKKNNSYYKNYNKLHIHNNCKLITLLEDYHGYNELYKWECLQCYKQFEAHYYACTCPCCFPQGISKLEKEIVDYLKSLGITNIVENSRFIISPQELDIYLPDYTLAIEFDGLYWHSELNGKDKNYHLNKTLECDKLNIRLIHIFENEWINKQEIVKARLRNILGKNENRVGARLCIVKEINNKEKNKFLKLYHMQGTDKAYINLGAYYNNKLISVMTFSKPRLALGQKNNKDNIWELSRFATINNTYTPGLASKILKYFEKNYKWKEIYSYADRRWSCGNLYTQLGFEFNSFTTPNYWYFYDVNLYHRFNFRKNVLLKKLITFDSNLTEWENMKMNGYDRIWDCGNYKYIIKSKK